MFVIYASEKYIHPSYSYINVKKIFKRKNIFYFFFKKILFIKYLNVKKK